MAGREYDPEEDGFHNPEWLNGLFTLYNKSTMVLVQKFKGVMTILEFDKALTPALLLEIPS